MEEVAPLSSRVDTEPPSRRVDTEPPNSRVHMEPPPSRVHMVRPPSRVHMQPPLSRAHTVAPKSRAASPRHPALSREDTAAQHHSSRVLPRPMGHLPSRRSKDRTLQHRRTVQLHLRVGTGAGAGMQA